MDQPAQWLTDSQIAQLDLLVRAFRVSSLKDDAPPNQQVRVGGTLRHLAYQVVTPVERPMAALLVFGLHFLPSPPFESVRRLYRGDMYLVTRDPQALELVATRYLDLGFDPAMDLGRRRQIGQFAFYDILVYITGLIAVEQKSVSDAVSLAIFNLNSVSFIKWEDLLPELITWVRGSSGRLKAVGLMDAHSQAAFESEAREQIGGRPDLGKRFELAQEALEAFFGISLS